MRHDPTALARRCQQARRSLGQPNSLRHTVATTLVSRGDLLAAQYRLGQRDPSTTLRIYSHTLPLHDQDAAALLDTLWTTGGPRPGDADAARQG